MSSCPGPVSSAAASSVAVSEPQVLAAQKPPSKLKAKDQDHGRTVSMQIPLPAKVSAQLLKALIGPPVKGFQKIANIDATTERVDFRPSVQELLQLPSLPEQRRQTTASANAKAGVTVGPPKGAAAAAAKSIAVSGDVIAEREFQLLDAADVGTQAILGGGTAPASVVSGSGSGSPPTPAAPAPASILSRLQDL